MTYHLVHHRLAGMVGHRFAEAMGFVQEFERRGMLVRLYMHESADQDVRKAFPGARAVLFDPVFSPQSFDQRTETFTQMLHQHLDHEISPDDRVLVTVATQCESRAFMKWLADLPAGRRPWVVVYMITDRWNFGAAEERDRQCAEWTVHGRELQVLPAEIRKRLILAAATGALAEEIGGLVGAPVVIASTPMPRSAMPPVSSPPQLPDRVLRVGVLGGARLEKGSALVPSIIRLARARVHVDFIVQLANEGLPEADFQALNALAGMPGILTFNAPDEYAQMLDAADVLLLPYEKRPYARRTSGVFLEGVFSGKPVVVPAGTWMAEQVETGEAVGVVFRRLTPEDVTDALVTCLHDYLSLRTRAHGRASTWREREGVTAFVDRMEQEIAMRQ